MSRLFATGSDHLDNNNPAWTAPAGTICAWIKSTSLVTPAQIVTLGTSGSGSNRFTLGMTSGAFFVCNENDGSSSVANATSPVLDTTNWHLAVGVWSDHTNRAAFFDGLSKGTIAALKASSAPNVTRISADPAGGNPAAMYIAHVAIWNIALIDADVLKLLTQLPSTVQAASLLEYWPLTGNASPEPSLGTSPHTLTVTGTAFSTDNPALGILQKSLSAGFQSLASAMQG